MFHLTAINHRTLQKIGKVTVASDLCCTITTTTIIMSACIGRARIDGGPSVGWSESAGGGRQSPSPPPPPPKKKKRKQCSHNMVMFIWIFSKTTISDVCFFCHVSLDFVLFIGDADINKKPVEPI